MEQALEQRQILSQRQVQLLKYIALKDDELRAVIESEAQKNPALIIKSDTHLSKHFNEAARDRHEAFLESLSDDRITLKEHLTRQVSEMNISREELSLCKAIIDNLDDNGYHIISPTTFSKDKCALKKCLNIVQNADPVGCAVNNMAESLKVQARSCISDRANQYFRKQNKKESINMQQDNFLQGNAFNRVEKSIESPRSDRNTFPTYSVFLCLVDFLIEHLKMLSPPDAALTYSKIDTYIMKETEKGSFWGVKVLPDGALTADNVSKAVSLIKSLTPYPAASYKKDEGGAFFDVEVKKCGNNLKIMYYNTLQKICVDSDYFDKRGVLNAKSFINIIEYRKRAVMTLIKNLVGLQRQFFLRGTDYLIPMTQQDLARAVGVDNSNISRLCNSRFLRCDWGIFALKYFFSSNVGGSSSTVIKGELRRLIGEYKGLSDRQIAEILKTRGYKVARRTVSKYRAALLIENSYKR